MFVCEKLNEVKWIVNYDKSVNIYIQAIKIYFNKVKANIGL